MSGWQTVSDEVLDLCLAAISTPRMRKFESKVMSSEPRSDVSRLLNDIGSGNAAAMDELCALVYEDLKLSARNLMRNERAAHTLQPTALVNEALLRLLDSELFAGSPSRARFYSAASRAMRRILVDHARSRSAEKRGGRWQRTAWDDLIEAYEEDGIDLESLDAALTKLQRLHERQYEVVQLRYFVGLTVQQIAELHGLSESSVEKDLQKARAFLYGEVSRG